jgi:hypothetical protein
MRSPTEEINKAVTAAFAAEGYTKANGDGVEVRDHRSAAEALFSAVKPYVVADKKDRYDNAGMLGELVSTAFPNVALTEEAIAEADDPLLAYEVSMKIRAYVWESYSPRRRGRVQKLVRQNLDNMTLVRVTLLSKGDPRDVVYLTNDLGCLRQDYEGPLRTKLEKLADSSAEDHVALIETHPDHAAKIAADFRTQSKKAINRGNDSVQLALDIVTGNGSEE